MCKGQVQDRSWQKLSSDMKDCLAGPQRTLAEKGVSAHFRSFSVTYLFSKYILSTWHMHGTVLGTANSAGTKQV